jgi:serine/threonine protein kinase
MSIPRDSGEGRDPSSEGAPLQAPGTPSGIVLADRFEICHTLGEGTVATTYLAVERCGQELRRLATVKLFGPEIAGDAPRLATLFANARSIAAIASPHLVNVRAASGDHEQPFIACDYIAGESLLTILARCTQLKRPPPTAVALRIAADACRGLGALHGCEMPLLHHALRPANLLVSYSGQACLADAGLGAAPLQLLADAALSAGLAQFIAPELLPGAAEVFGDPVGPTTDIYALAAALYVMVTLRFPFDDKQLGELIATKQEVGAVAARERRATVPGELEALLARGLSPMAADRQQSATELEDELRFLIKEGGDAADHADVARWLAELFADQLPQKQRLLRRLLWPGEQLAEPAAVGPEPISDADGSSLVPQPMATLPQTQLEELPNEEPTRTEGDGRLADSAAMPTPQPTPPLDEAPPDELDSEEDTSVGAPPPPTVQLAEELSRMPSAEEVSFGRAIPTEEVETGRIPDSDLRETKVEALLSATPASLPADAPPPPEDDDEGPTAVTALQDVYSDSATVRRQHDAKTAERGAVPPPAPDAGSTPEPEPAFGGEPDQQRPEQEPEGDTVRAAKPERAWNATATDMTTVPFDDTDEKTHSSSSASSRRDQLADSDDDNAEPRGRRRGRRRSR